MKVLIAGAGIGGLTAALCLHKSGHQVTIVEKSKQLVAVGSGLQLGANAVKVLDYLGLLEPLSSVSVDPSRVEFRDYKSGACLHRMDLGASYQQRFGAPYLHVHRADLQNVLLKAAQIVEGISVRLGAELESFTENQQDVQLRLGNGVELSGDCLIGADGIKSIVRQHVVADHRPEFTGNVAWRAAVPTDRLPIGWMDKITSNFVGPNKHAVLYYLRGQELANLVGVVENPNWTDDEWMTQAPWEDLKADFDGWHPTVESIIDAVDRDQCYRWALYHHKPFSNWSTARVTLLGDAAHATLPFMAAGAALAIEDARILDRCLAEQESLGDALRRYQNNRRARTAHVQRSSARLGKLYHINNDAIRRAAFSALGVLGKNQQDFLPSYDANRVKLV